MSSMCHYCSEVGADFGLPISHNDRNNSFQTINKYCDASCALAWAYRSYGCGGVSSIVFWLQKLARQSGYTGMVKAAPPREMLECFGGKLTRDEFDDMKKGGRPARMALDARLGEGAADVVSGALLCTPFNDELMRIRDARTDIHGSQPVLDAMRFALDPKTNPTLNPKLVMVRFGKRTSVIPPDMLLLWANTLSMHYGIETASDLAQEISSGQEIWMQAIVTRSMTSKTPCVNKMAVNGIVTAFRDAGMLSEAEAKMAALDDLNATVDDESMEASSMFDSVMTLHGKLTPEQRAAAAADDRRRKRETRRQRQRAAARGAGRLSSTKRQKTTGSRDVLSYFSSTETTKAAAALETAK